jgi:hypothetical protein
MSRQGPRNLLRRVGPTHAAHQLVCSGQRMPVPSKELGLGGEERRLPSEVTSAGHQSHGCLPHRYSSAINGTDSLAMLPKTGTAATYFWSG